MSVRVCEGGKACVKFSSDCTYGFCCATNKELYGGETPARMQIFAHTHAHTFAHVHQCGGELPIKARAK